MSLGYFEIWHRQLREPVGPLTESDARARHANNKPYVAVVSDETGPTAFIEVNDGFYGVSFIDEQRREYLMYTFDEIESGRLFLREAIHREYADVSARPSEAAAYRFDPAGFVSVERGIHPFDRVAEKRKAVDVSRNWEVKPAFGDYSPLLRKER